ncbi:conjugal transfer protein TraD [Bartonella sp. HY761]|uniref:conjugal transfer protein TraD n=1 Tax=Bartonella sp. HY761 TaxID=2979330 RepID=UPI0021E1D893|nr:conjugal transfer protein TraD [Bartonella sp. HY761]UXN08165.1 conjugal transfer protein TraD [Bartonella sp. HY761]
MQDKWLKSRIDYLRGIKNLNEQQKLLLLLIDKSEKTSDDEKKIAAIVRAEKAAERAIKARADAARILNTEKKNERKLRDREMYQSAGLLVLSGLVDGKTGKPFRDRAELLGALATLASSKIAEERWQEWKIKGEQILAEKKG